jgi:hypothetical protein
MMKRFAIAAILLAVAVPISIGAEYHRGGADTGGVYLIVSAQAPGSMKRGGPNVYLTDYNADNVQIQAAIDLAQANDTSGLYSPDLVLVAGRYDFDAPIYIGYNPAQTVPNSNFGVNIRTLGDVTFVNNGGTADDEGKFLVYCAPKDGATGYKSIIGPLNINATGMAGGIYANGMHNSRVQDVVVNGGAVAGGWFENSWLMRVENFRSYGPSGIGFGLRGSASVISRLGVVGADSTALGGGTVGGLKRYTVDNESGTFVEGEEVIISGGAERGILLTRELSTSYIIGHGSRTAFANNETIEGSISGATADVNVTIEDLGCALYVAGAETVVEGVNIETNILADDANGIDLPLVLVSDTDPNWSASPTFRDIRFEGTTTNDSVRRQAKTYFRFINAPNIVLDKVHATNTVYVVVDPAVTVVDEGATGTISNVAATITAGLLDDGTDTVYIYDGPGGMTDGLFTVTSGSVASAPTTTFTIDEDPGASVAADGARVYFTSLAASRQPTYCVDLQDCDNASIRNLNTTSFATALVKIDANCENVSVENIMDHPAQMYAGTEDTWLRAGKHGDILADSGVNTKLINPFIPDYTGLIYVARTGVEVITETDGTNNKTTLLLKDQTVTLADEAGVVAYGGQKVFDFPAGAILVEGVTTDLDITKSSAGVNDDWDGDYAVGSVTASNNATLTATEDDMLPSTATPQASSGATTANGQSTAAENVVIDGTSTAVDALLNFLVDDADHNVGGTACNLIVNGKIIIHWRNLGDY